MRLLALAALAGCYSAPSSNASCTLLCTDSCPDEMACSNGYCVAADQRCEPTFERVSAGNGFVCALDTNRRRWCWGANDQHQLDDSSRATLMYATLVDSGPWDEITTGGDHTCGLRDGALYCWGGNDRQQVSGTISGDVEQTLRIDAPDRAMWTSVVAGYATTCGIAGGKLYCWGANNRGQVGIAPGPDVGAPTQIGALADWTTVAVGRDHACAISTSSGLLCWGANGNGQLGAGDVVGTTFEKLPTPVALPGVTAMALAGTATCAIANGQLYCWGRATSTVLGDVAVDPCVGATSKPALASTLDGWTELTASRDQMCGLRAGELWCWGTTTSGLGIGVWASSGFTKVADAVSDVSVGWNTNIDDLGVESGDLDVTCFIADGAVQCWGDNRYGQLAQGVASMAVEPVEIAGGHVWAALETADSHTCGIDAAGVPMCWGTNAGGQITGAPTGSTAVPCDGNVLCAAGAPTPLPFTSHADAIKLGDDHTCVLDAGVLTCWGQNNHGQLGATTNTSPAVIAGAWTGLYATGGKAQCAVQGGQTYCWGSLTSFRQPLARDTRFDNMKSIGITAVIGNATIAGNARTHGCMLGANNLLACFGVDTHGQFGRGRLTQVCGNGICDLDEREETCGDCIGKRTCATNACGVQSCNPVCGDGACNLGYGETCSACAADCGACPYVPLTRNYAAMSVNVDSTTGFSCGIRPDLRIECWGRNNSGQAGALDGSTGRVIDPVFTPSLIADLDSCTAVSTGGSSACAICGGEIYCWGNHRTGAVGAGAPTAFPITKPRKLAIDLDDADQWAQLVSGQGFSCARSAAGRGFCWGFHARGALGTGGVSLNLPAPIRTAP